MIEMIERVAEAIYTAIYSDPASRFGAKYPELSERARNLYREAARAAIEAMREPTDAALQSALDAMAAANTELVNERDSARWSAGVLRLELTRMREAANLWTAVTRDMVERACKAEYPKLFSDDPKVAHMAASPMRLDLTQDNHRASIRRILEAALALPKLSP